MTTRQYNFARDTAKNHRLINDPIIISDKFLKDIGIPSYDSNLTFKINLSDYRSKKNPGVLEAYSSNMLDQELPRKQKYKDSESDIRKKSLLAETAISFTNNNPFENTILKNQIENASTGFEMGSIRPYTSNSFNPTVKIKEISISIDRGTGSKESNTRYVHSFVNHQNGFKVYSEKDKILRKAALKYFNNFETLQMKRDTKAKTDHLDFASDSGHIQLPSRPHTRYLTPTARRNTPLISRGTRVRFQNQDSINLRSRKVSDIPTNFEQSYLIDVPFKVKPTKITYVEELEKKYFVMGTNTLESSITEY